MGLATNLEYHWREIELAPLILDAVPLGLARHSVVTDVPAGCRWSWPTANGCSRSSRTCWNNAVKYSPEGGAITARVRERDAEHVLIEIADQGLGIPADQVGRLFQLAEDYGATGSRRAPERGGDRAIDS